MYFYGLNHLLSYVLFLIQKFAQFVGDVPIFSDFFKTLVIIVIY